MPIIRPDRPRPTAGVPDGDGPVRLLVGVGDLKVSDDPRAMIVTPALGSCIAVVVHDPVRAIGGMLHYMLPHSSTNREKAEKNPAMFADTGVPLLFEKMYALGAEKRRIVVTVAGGAKLNGMPVSQEIGKRNYVILRKMFSKNGIRIDAEDVGGTRSRSVKLFVGTGRVVVTTSGVDVEW